MHATSGGRAKHAVLKRAEPSSAPGDEGATTACMEAAHDDVKAAALPKPSTGAARLRSWHARYSQPGSCTAAERAVTPPSAADALTSMLSACGKTRESSAW